LIQIRDGLEARGKNVVRGFGTMIASEVVERLARGVTE
jgi:hypothetical protein